MNLEDGQRDKYLWGQKDLNKTEMSVLLTIRKMQLFSDYKRIS